MSKDSFQVHNHNFEYDVQECECENFSSSSNISNETPFLQNSDMTPMTTLPSFTEIGEGEISVASNSLNLHVPIVFSLFGNRYLISDSMNYRNGLIRRSYVVRSGDENSLRIEVIIDLNKIKAIPSISLIIESTNDGKKNSGTFVISPKVEISQDISNNIQSIFRNIQNTKIWRFVTAFPQFESLGPINPSSILLDSNILLRRALFKKGIQNLSQLNESEVNLIGLERSELQEANDWLKCGGGVVSGAIGGAGLAGVSSLGIGALPGAVVGGIAGGLASDCYKTITASFGDKEPQTTSTSDGRDVSCSPGYYRDFDTVTKTWVCKESRTGKPPLESCPAGSSWKLVPGPHPDLDNYGGNIWKCVPDTITLEPVTITASRPKPIPPEKIRWVQTILKVTNGESILAVDGIIGPMTREALKRFQQRFGLVTNGSVNQETTNALIQHGLNHIFRRSRLVVDGKMGPKTKSAIIDFQSTHESGPKDGIVGPITRAAMIKVLMESQEIRIRLPRSSSEVITEGWTNEY
jgi:peptidoglycan hydrolase-like protein with peptidoglycan-binding domain